MINFRKNRIYLESFQKVKTDLISVGIKKTDAEIIADCLALSDSFGVFSHGSKLIPSYISMIKSGKFNLNPQYSIEVETPSFAKIDGDNSIGVLSANHCLKYAIEKAKQSGVFTIFSRNNNTFGPAFYYSLLAAEQKMICFITSNSPAQMPILFDGKEKMLGTNPFSICFPSSEDYPIIVDMASSAIAKSKILEYKEKGIALPDGWALDSDGKPTNDPDEALNGFMMPMSGIKGYSISLSIDILAGLLSGAAFLNNVGKFYSNNTQKMDVGFYLTVINPYLVYGKDYDDKIKQYIDTIRNSSSENQNIVLPGDDRIAFHKKNSF
ncbi:MAG: Ldh family oxidoreductase [Bacilli bacterium]|nr:Ldh family oxidoreductase [Bacilli bacterium]